MLKDFNIKKQYQPLFSIHPYYKPVIIIRKDIL